MPWKGKPYMNRPVTGCIVTYNNMRTIEQALSTVLGCTSCDFRLYVVDNGSTDGTPEFIEKNYPQVTLIRSSSNIGFGAGHNSVIDLLDSEYHAIINPDVVLRDDIISDMASFLDSHEEIGMLSPCIKFPDGRPQILGKRNPTLRYLFASRMRGSGEPSDILSEYAMLNEDLSKPVRIENASGCFIFIRTELFRKLGGFDKRYFMYFEDCDLSREVNRVSNVYYYPDATVYHEWGRDSKRDLKLKLVHLKSMFSYFIKWKLGRR